jgi:hypothetical protein
MNCDEGTWGVDDAFPDDIYWHEQARRQGDRRRRTDKADGYFATGEDEAMNEKQEHPSVKIEINCICGRPLEAATYLQDGLIKLVIAPCRCAEEE